MKLKFPLCVSVNLAYITSELTTCHAAAVTFDTSHFGIGARVRLMTLVVYAWTTRCHMLPTPLRIKLQVRLEHGVVLLAFVLYRGTKNIYVRLRISRHWLTDWLTVIVYVSKVRMCFRHDAWAVVSLRLLLQPISAVEKAERKIIYVRNRYVYPRKKILRTSPTLSCAGLSRSNALRTQIPFGHCDWAPAYTGVHRCTEVWPTNWVALRRVALNWP